MVVFLQLKFDHSLKDFLSSDGNYSFTHRSVKSFTMATGPKQSLVEKSHGDYLDVLKVKCVIVSVVYKTKWLVI